MLIEFRVENWRSLRDEQALTMEAALPDESAPGVARAVEGYAKPLLPVAALYGPNASGKSNVLKAFDFMADAVLDSHRFWPPDRGVPRVPFAWGGKRSTPSLFEVMVVLDGTRFCYGFEASQEAITEEWLYAWPNGKKQAWLRRSGMEFRFGAGFKGENALIKQVTRPNALFLSTAAQHRHAQVSAIFSWFESVEVVANMSYSVVGHDLGLQDVDLLYREHFKYVNRVINSPGVRVLEGTTASFPSLREDEVASLIEWLRDLVQNADVGIADIGLEEVKDPDSGRARKRIFFRHRGQPEGEGLALQDESQGTRVLFRLGLAIWRVLRDGGLILVDELESSLHPILARQIVRQFNDPKANPKNAQLIFTTHDTNLLGSFAGGPVLRRDQVWLTEKSGEGATVLYPLTDFKPRKAENLERGYLQGRYGAIPFLDDFTLAPR